MKAVLYYLLYYVVPAPGVFGKFGRATLSCFPGHWDVEFSALAAAQLLRQVSRIQEVDADSGPISCGGIWACGMRCPETEEHDTPSRYFAMHGVRVVRCHADVMVTAGISKMLVVFIEHAWYDFERAVCLGRIVQGNPHSRSL